MASPEATTMNPANPGAPAEANAGSPANGERMVRWPVFSQPGTLLRMVYTRSGGSFFVLGSRDPALLARAEEIGFEIPSRNADVVRSIPVGRIRLSDITRNLGATVKAMTRAEFMASSHFQHKGQPRPAAPTPNAREDAKNTESRRRARPTTADLAEAERKADEAAQAGMDERIDMLVDQARMIGVNMLGQDVYEDEGGRYRIAVQGPRRRLVPEIEPGATQAAQAARGQGPASGQGDVRNDAALFLRGVDQRAYDQAAAGIVREAANRPIRASALTGLAEALCASGPRGEALLHDSREDAAGTLRRAITREIFGSASRSATSQAAFLSVVKSHEALVGLRDLGGGDRDLSAPLAAAIARAMDLPSVEPGLISIHSPLADSGTLALAAPDGASFNAGGSGEERPAGQPAVQLVDFRGRGGAAPDMAMAAISRRADDGRMLLVIDGGPDTDEAEKIRSDLGTIYAIESVMHLSGSLAGSDPVSAGEGLMIFAIGARRPEPLPSLPEAARRTIQASLPHDLWSWATETRRARGRIAEWIGAEAGEGGQADDKALREESQRQVPYQPLSRLGEAVTMIPRTLHGATSTALARVSRFHEESGGVDTWLAAALQISPGQLEERFSPEQIDAIAMAHHAFGRGRGFLEADQTGVGKGRALAGIAAVWVNAGPRGDHGASPRRVIYFTERGDVNVPDVYRDIVDTGTDEAFSIKVLANGTEVRGPDGDVRLKSLSVKERRETTESGVWPDDSNLVITTYSMFNRRESAASEWLRAVVDENTLVILDECQNALNPSGATGHNIRLALENAGAQCFASATPLREPGGAGLYRSLLPDGMRERDIGSELAAGGASVQEVFTTMLASDGVMIRRDHDLANILFEVSLPDPELTERYHDAMERLAPVVSAMLTASGEASDVVSRHMERARAAMERAHRGWDNRRITDRLKKLHSYAVGFGSPLVNLTNVYLNALKVDQTVQDALDEIREGRKPMISLHSTNGAFLDSLARDADGRLLPDDQIAGLPPLTVRDQLMRIHDRLYRARVDGEFTDLRDGNPHLRRVSDEIEAMIAELPELTASPIDALTERLEREGLRVGELTGRKLQYRDGTLSRRPRHSRRAIIDGYNNGDIDVLIYNSAGATGGSYHASPLFADQRPRTMIEMETPPDIIRYVQGQGRGNRYGQVARPKVKSAVSGLTPEMRLIAFRNRKLRSLGASVEGNREHPMLLREAPDIINSVGDAAASRLLLMRPDIARRLDLSLDDGNEGNEAAGEQQVNAQVRDIDGDNLGSSSTQNLANRLIARSILLTVKEQEEIFAHLEAEFEVLVEELDAQNRNPLRPRQLDGWIEVRSTTLFSGVESNEGEDLSAFLAPVRVSTGRHVYADNAISGQRMLEMVNRGMVESGGDGFVPFAHAVEERRHTYLLALVGDGQTVDEALAQGHFRISQANARLENLRNVLEQMRPGTVFSMDWLAGEPETMVVTRTIAPNKSGLNMFSSSYAFNCVCPGESKARRMTLSRLCDEPTLQFHGNVLDDDPTMICAEFDRMVDQVRAMPVQVLTGNVLEANHVARNNKLGAMVLFQDQDGVTHRGIAVNPNKVNLEYLPIPVSARCIVDGYRSGRFEEGLYGWMPGEKDSETIVNLNYFAEKGRIDRKVFFRAPPFNLRWREFWQSDPRMGEIYRLVSGKDLPADPVQGARSIVKCEMELLDPRLDRLAMLIDRCEPIRLQCSGRAREWVNGWLARTAAGADYAEPAAAAAGMNDGGVPEVNAPAGADMPAGAAVTDGVGAGADDLAADQPGEEAGRGEREPGIDFRNVDRRPDPAVFDAF